MLGGITMNMKKIMIGIMLGVSFSVFFCACGKEEDLGNGNNISKATGEEDVSTGYPSGEVQREYVMVNDVLYCYEGKTQESIEQIGEKGYTKAGEITLCDNTKIPETNFTAAHLDTGTAIYTNEKEVEYIYLEVEDGELLVFQKQ